MNAEEDWARGLRGQDLQENALLLKWPDMQGTPQRRLVTPVSAHRPTRPTPCLLSASYLCFCKAFQDVMMVKFVILLNIFLPIFCFYLFIPYSTNLKFFVSPTPRKRNSGKRGMRVVCYKGNSVLGIGDDFYCPFRFLTLVSTAL